MSEELFPVTVLDEGQEATVRLLSGGEALTGRLSAMGIIPGTRIKASQEEPWADHYPGLGHQGRTWQGSGRENTRHTGNTAIRSAA